MSDLLAARSQMAVSLGFHIIFAEVGIAMPLMMVHRRVAVAADGRRGYLELAKRWAKGTAIFFAVGAVSGTVLSFELGLLWPGFMRYAGALIGMPFSLEGFAFFTEAIFLGVYLYGWERIGPRAHLASGALVALSGALSAVFVVMVNAWMNAPTGFRVDGGRRLRDIDPIAAMRSPAALARGAAHAARRLRRDGAGGRRRSTPACCCAARSRRFHRRALGDRAARRRAGRDAAAARPAI